MALLFRVRWIGTCDRLQRDEIDGRLQDAFSSGNDYQIRYRVDY